MYCSNGGANVGSKCQWAHLFKAESPHTNQGSQSGSGDGGRLNNDGDASSNGNRNVSIDIRGLVDDTGRETEEQLLENGDDTEQAAKEDHNADKEHDTSRDLVILFSGVGGEESRAVTSLLVAGCKSKCTNSISL